ncbi:MAG: Fur family ferric uptake transcriptional regulator, partial [Planctomycetota bacterium]
TTVEKRFEEYLKQHELKMTSQRKRILQRAYETHDHFSADTLHSWLREQEASKVSRATVYRTLDLLEQGGFIQSLNTGNSELVYEHTLGHKHHDHMICVTCGHIEEFHDERIEELQEAAAKRRGFQVQSHVHRLMGLCKSCAKTP